MNRKSLLTAIRKTGVALTKNKTERENLRWVLAGQCFNLRATYSAGNEKAALAAAATESGFTESDIGNLIRAYEVREELTQAQRSKVESWTTDAALTLRGKDMTTGNRTKLIAKAESKGTQNVKTLREMKKAIVGGGSTRNRKSQKDQNIALAKSLEKDIARLFKSHNPVSLIAGAQFAQDHPGKDIAAALLFASAQVTAEPAVK